MSNLRRLRFIFVALVLTVPALSFSFDLGGVLKHGATAVAHDAGSLRQVLGLPGSPGGEGAIPELPAPNGSFGGCAASFAGGVAPYVQDIQRHRARALCFDGFAVLHSGLTKTPIFSAEVLNRQRLAAARGEARTDFFFADARLPAAERAALDDYRGKGYDRGHMAPAADMAEQRSMAQSFSLANIVPQSPKNNQFAWASIEKATRQYVNRATGNVYVITGPVFAGQRSFGPPIGRGQVWVPSHLFKLVYDASSNRAWAHWLENTDEARVGAPISYSELVRRTGVEWLPGIRPAD